MKAFKTESKKLLDLMINSIYTNHEIFLRELVSNASDALDKVRLVYAKKDEDEPSDLGIHISFDPAQRLLTVSDNGIGMDKTALEECLGTIAHSDSFLVKADAHGDSSPGGVDIIGQFGVGFYSAFMVADHVRVVSRAMGVEEAYAWESDGVDGYTISPADRPGQGTDVILRIRESSAEENLERYLDQSSIQYLVRRYSNYIRYPITMDLADEHFDENAQLVRDETTVKRTVVNSVNPIWTLDEADVSREELDAFYRFEFRDADAPLRVIRARARGAIEYDALLFVPATAPDDLYAKDARYGVKLYSAGVLIDEECSCLLAGHLRFVRGIVETRNVNLNVSREAIQEDGRIQIIARQLERSIMESIKAMPQDDRQGYERFYRAFGTGLKFSICTSRGMLANVLSPLLMYTSARTGKLITLQEYLDGAGDARGAEILYAVGRDAGRLRNTPVVDAAVSRGRDVLLCTNGAQDEFCFMVMGAYKGAPFHSVTSSNLTLQNSGSQEPQDKSERFQGVLSALKELAPLPLLRVVESEYLTSPEHPAACIATEGLMTISMAKFVMSKLEKDEVPEPTYVLEVNTSHELFQMAREAYEQNRRDVLGDLANVLLGQAFLAEDVALSDPRAFNAATNRIIRGIYAGR